MRTKRDKVLTMQLIKDAAREIILKEGVKALKVNRLERDSGRSKRMFYDYFENLDNLLKIILEENDPWLVYKEKFSVIKEEHALDYGKRLVPMLLRSHLSSFSKDRIAREVSRLELTERDELIKELAISREHVGEKLFSFIDPYFKNSDIDIRLVIAVLIGGINYLTLHAEVTGSTFCGAKLNNEKTMDDLERTLTQIIGLVYDQAKKSRALSLVDVGR